MTGPAPKLVASHGLGDLSFDEALERCRFRSICRPSAKAGGDVTIHAAVTLLGPPGRLRQELVERLYAHVRDGDAFLVACEFEATLKNVLGLVDQMAGLAALAAAPVAGNA